MTQQITAHYNQLHQQQHQALFESAAAILSLKNIEVNGIINQLQQLQVAIPSWALGTGGTRFGRFAGGGEPRNLAEKIEDVGLVKSLSGAASSVSLHIPWDIPGNAATVQQQLRQYGLTIDSVNSNTFQDQPGQAHSYKFGSLCHTNESVRQQAIAHNIEVIEHGKNLDSTVLTVWLADGSNFPGQHHFRKAFERTLNALQKIYAALPAHWTMLVEYKPYEPNFYSMVIPDWGTSKALCDALGPQAKVLVDLGHHLPNTNIEQIVARLLHFRSLGGFHFNGSMYGDDDLSTGSIKPFQLFLIFNELVDAAQDAQLPAQAIAYMIDASHNTKDPVADLLQSLENISIAFAKALLVNRKQLHAAQEQNDVVLAEQILQDAFQTDVRSLVAEARRRNGFAINPVDCFLKNDFRAQRIQQRGVHATATGL
jgi:L-rhamnose isomerase / sugar isomerase